MAEKFLWFRAALVKRYLPRFSLPYQAISCIMKQRGRRLRRSVFWGAGAFREEMTEMTEPVQVGVIGGGYLGRFHPEKYAALAETELMGVADLNRDQARKVAHALHPRDFAAYRELLPLAAAVWYANCIAKVVGYPVVGGKAWPPGSW